MSDGPMLGLVIMLLVAVYGAAVSAGTVVALRQRGWAPPNRYRFRWDCPNGCGTWFVGSHATDPVLAAKVIDDGAEQHLARCPNRVGV